MKIAKVTGVLLATCMIAGSASAVQIGIEILAMPVDARNEFEIRDDTVEVYLDQCQLADNDFNSRNTMTPRERRKLVQECKDEVMRRFQPVKPTPELS